MRSSLSRCGRLLAAAAFLVVTVGAPGVGLAVIRDAKVPATDEKRTGRITAARDGDLALSSAFNARTVEYHVATGGSGVGLYGKGHGVARSHVHHVGGAGIALGARRSGWARWTGIARGAWVTGRACRTVGAGRAGGDLAVGQLHLVALARDGLVRLVHELELDPGPVGRRRLVARGLLVRRPVVLRALHRRGQGRAGGVGRPAGSPAAAGVVARGHV